MSDLIDRQAVYDAITEIDCGINMDIYTDEVRKIIDDIPTVGMVKVHSDDAISRQAVLDTIHQFFTEEVDKIPTKKTEDGEVYVIHKCQPLFEMNKAICKRIKALPSDSPTQNCVGNALNALDCISRQAVNDLISKFIIEIHTEGGRDLNAHTNDVLRQILRNINSDEVLPSFNPQEPKTDLLDKIRAEIDKWHHLTDKAFNDGIDTALEIIDKYKAESEDKE